MKKGEKNIVLIFLFFSTSLLISIFNPLGGTEVTDQIKMIFSFVSFLFGILSGFFIASLWDRFTKIRKLTSVESASLENIYKFFELADKEVAKNIAEKIDEYIIKALEYDLHKYQEELSEEYFALYQELDDLKQEGLSGTLANRILSIFDNLTKSRKEILSRGKDKLGIFHWITIFFLASLTIYIWLYIQFSGIFGIVIGTILIFSILTVIAIIYDLNNLTWGTERMDIEVYERIYDVMGMPRYYPEESLGKLTIPKGLDEYRIGILEDSDSHKRKIKKVNVD